MKEALYGILAGVVILGLKYLFTKKDKGVTWEEGGFMDIKYSNEQVPAHIKKGLFLAAPYSIVSNLEMNTLKVNSMNTKEEKESWKSSWNVVDHDSAITNLKWLLLEGHRMDMYEWISIFNSGNKEGLTTEAIATLNLLEKVKKELNINGQLPPFGAWDFARLANNARAFHSLGYISSKEAEHYLAGALRQAQQEYNSWAEYGQGFVLGRVIWSDAINQQFIDVHHKLMQDKNSPYLSNDFK